MPLLQCEQIISDIEFANLTKGGLEHLKERIIDRLSLLLLDEIKKYGILTKVDDAYSEETRFILSVFIDSPFTKNKGMTYNIGADRVPNL